MAGIIKFLEHESVQLQDKSKKGTLTGRYKNEKDETWLEVIWKEISGQEQKDIEFVLEKDLQKYFWYFDPVEREKWEKEEDEKKNKRLAKLFGRMLNILVHKVTTDLEEFVQSIRRWNHRTVRLEFATDQVIVEQFECSCTSDIENFSVKEYYNSDGILCFEEFKTKLKKFAEQFWLPEEEIIHWFDAMQKKTRFERYDCLLLDFNRPSAKDYRPEFANVDTLLSEMAKLRTTLTQRCHFEEFTDTDIYRIFAIYSLIFGEITIETFFPSPLSKK
jgi:hypothetical protein